MTHFAMFLGAVATIYFCFLVVFYSFQSQHRCIATGHLNVYINPLSKTDEMCQKSSWLCPEFWFKIAWRLIHQVFDKIEIIA